MFVWVINMLKQKIVIIRYNTYTGLPLWLVKVEDLCVIFRLLNLLNVPGACDFLTSFIGVWHQCVSEFCPEAPEDGQHANTRLKILRFYQPIGIEGDSHFTATRVVIVFHLHVWRE